MKSSFGQARLPIHLTAFGRLKSSIRFTKWILRILRVHSSINTGFSMDPNGKMDQTVQLVKSVSDKHLDLLRPSARICSIFKGQGKDAPDHIRSKYTLLRDVEDAQVGLYDKPLPCFGCGIGWFSFLLGFFFPLLWYYATILYFWNARRDPRERAGLAASAIAALACSILLLIVVAVLL
ncbi:uncharacterized protein LOC101207093 isoform X1 [Cucumis sativus]|uniref:uncharacterized protein LOC101207093 isoform X1 n=1 Tax=Cucumis sativus TaxID=3659 RepID=UPI0005EC2EFA|nr:uncharacterized protein LOC101207093 isoform X1 [Cucumis sativus]